MPRKKKPEWIEVKLDDLTSSPLNPRKTFSEASLRELGEALTSEVGQLQPCVVRPMRLEGGRVLAGGYEVICGERRLRAAALVGKESLWCHVRHDLDDDDDALDAMLAENNQREDVAPLEEAEAFQALLDRGRTPAQIAAKLGRSETYVRQRLRLTTLGPEARQLLAHDLLQIGAALALAACGADTQRETIGLLGEELNWPEDLDRLGEKRDQWTPAPAVAKVEHVREALGATKRQLAVAPWSLDDAELVPSAGPCAKCPKRSGDQRELFEDVVEDLCLDARCWRAKGEALARRMAADGVAVVTGPEADKLLQWGRLGAGAGLIDLDEDFGFYYEAAPEGLRTWRDVLTAAGAIEDLEVTVVAGDTLHRAVDETAAWEAAARVAPQDAAARAPAGVRKKVQAETGASPPRDPWKEQERKRQEKAKLQRDERRRCTQALVAAIEGESGPPTGDVAELLVGITLRTVGQLVLDDVCKRRGLKAESHEREEALRRLLEEMDEESEVWALLVELLIGQEMQASAWSDRDPLKAGEQVRALLDHYVVDVAKHRREAKAAAKPKKRKPKTKRTARAS